MTREELEDEVIRLEHFARHQEGMRDVLEQLLEQQRRLKFFYKIATYVLLALYINSITH